MSGATLRRCALGALFTLGAACQGGTAVQPAPPRPRPLLEPPKASPGPVLASQPLPSGGACAASPAPGDPLAYGRCVLAGALARAKSGAGVTVALASDAAALGVEVEAQPESYSIVPRADATLVVGRDAVGAMYGAMDLAERLDDRGGAALPLTAPVKASPRLKIRAANLFLTLPEKGRGWWFHDPRFWTEYLDMMARGRLNLLDLHGMYDPKSTNFPNALLYFATSARLPDVGLSRPDREANLGMLNLVIAMAASRGIQVGIMSYRADLSLMADEKESTGEKAEVPGYTREAVTDLATRAPGLAYLGFRVGESDRSADWYASTYIQGLKDAHARAAAYTRTWKTQKKDLLDVVLGAGPETIVEAKYNGEHLGPPYVVSGGGMEKWASYSYQDYLTPPTPYRFVFQVRAGGTHRIFRYASYERTRRAVLAMNLSPRVEGFTFEAAHAYLPFRDFYHAHPEDSFSPWSFRRDELSYILFGRLGYDPATPETVFRAMLRERVGTDGLWDAVQAASDITPWMLAGHTCGPDQRDYAPELELAGPVGYWATPVNTKGPHPSCGGAHRPFDAFALAPPAEAARDLLERRGTSRLSPVDLALMILADAKAARAAKQVAIDATNPEARDVVRECVALADLGEWFAHKYRGATALGVYEGSGAAPWLLAARSETRAADAAYTALARDTEYILPFDEHMRMSYELLPNFHWRKQLPHLPEDPASIDAVEGRVRAANTPFHVRGPLPEPSAWLGAARRPGPGLAELQVTPNDPHAPAWTVSITLASSPPSGAVVRVLHRPFRSDGLAWEASDATGSGTTWTATVAGGAEGGMFAVEVDAGPGKAWRYPDVARETPYRALAP